MRKIEMILDDEKGLTLNTKDDFTLDELLGVSLLSVKLAADVCYKQIIKKNPDADERNVRANIYDTIILAVSEITEELYPEHHELYKKTPEELLSELNNKIEQLDAKNGQEQS